MRHVSGIECVGGMTAKLARNTRKDPMRIVTDAETLKAHIEAELHNADWATPTERKQVSKVANAIIDRLNRPEKVSDITGFPEDDDDVELTEEDQYEALIAIKPTCTPKLRRRIPGMPREL